MTYDNTDTTMQGRSIPMAPGGSPVCCGSDTLTADSELSSTGNFSRSAVGGAFQVGGPQEVR